MAASRRWRFVLGVALVGSGGTFAFLRDPARVGVVPPPEVEPELPLFRRPEGQPLALPDPVFGGREMLVAFFVDGLSASRFEQALVRGDLPNLARLFRDHPSWVGRARSTFPTSTAPAIPEALAGRWSDRLGGMPDNIHVLDRAEGRLIRYEVEHARWDGNALTLFDRLAGEGGVSFVYFEGYFPGANITVHDELLYLLDTVVTGVREGTVLAYDARMVEDLRTRFEVARQAPNLVFIRLGAVDTAGHFYGPESPSYAAAISAVDERIGEVLEVLRAAELEDGRTAYEAAHFALFSDHGMSSTERRFDLDADLRALGFTPFPTSTPRAIVASVLRPDGIFQSDIVAVPDGSNLAAIYLRARGSKALLPWGKAPPAGAARSIALPAGQVDLVAHLLATPDVLRVYERGPEGSVVAHGKEGAVRVETRHGADGEVELAAFVFGTDPFGDCARHLDVCCTKFSDACFQSEAEWRESTRSWDRPELPRMVLKPFQGPENRRPDLLVESAPGVGFLADTQGDHGRYDPELLSVPLVLAGARVDPDATVVDARLVDLAPTLFPLFGIPQDPTADGMDLEVVHGPTPQLRHRE